MDFQLGPWLVQPEVNSLVRGRRTSKVTPKAMDVLVCLAKRQGEVTSKDEIFREVWPETFVSDDALFYCIGELRRALRFAGRETEVIQTISKRGYRIGAPVTWVDAVTPQEVPAAEEAPTPKRSAWKRWYLPAGGALLVLLGIVLAAGRGVLRPHALISPPIQSLAVLPLTNLSGDPEQEYFADGMSEALITELAHIDTWKVISRTSVMRYKATRKPLPEIARDLTVDAVVEGTVLRSGTRVRITAQLIRAATDSHLWSGSFEGEIGDVLALQDRIAKAIATEVRGTLRPEVQSRSNRARRVTPAAYEAYLKGWYFFNRSDFLKAASYFEQATVEDPNFALAHAMLAESDGMFTSRHDAPLSPRVPQALERARALDDTLAELHSALGDRKFFEQWHWAEGEAEYRRAVELDGASVDAIWHYALCLHVLARWDDALRQYRRALELDPLAPLLHATMASLFADTHQNEEAALQYQKAIELDPDMVFAYSGIGPVFQALGRDAEALAAYLKADSLSHRSADELQALHGAATRGGIRGYWNKRLEQALEPANRPAVPLMELANLYLEAGDRDRAVRTLESAYEKRVPRLPWIRVRTAWDPLRSDPRFQLLLRKMRFPE